MLSKVKPILPHHNYFARLLDIVKFQQNAEDIDARREKI